MFTKEGGIYAVPDYAGYCIYVLPQIYSFVVIQEGAVLYSICMLYNTSSIFLNHTLAEVMVKYRDKIRKLEPEIKEIMKQEEEEKEVRSFNPCRARD